MEKESKTGWTNLGGTLCGLGAITKYKIEIKYK